MILKDLVQVAPVDVCRIGRCSILNYSFSMLHRYMLYLGKIPSDRTRMTQMSVCILRTEHKKLQVHAWNCSNSDCLKEEAKKLQNAPTVAQSASSLMQQR
jgi:hypothetical protein